MNINRTAVLMKEVTEKTPKEYRSTLSTLFSELEQAVNSLLFEYAASRYHLSQILTPHIQSDAPTQFIHAKAKELCRDLRISENAYAPCVAIALYGGVNFDSDIVVRYINPIINNFIIATASKRYGKQGGRPEHMLKAKALTEALLIKERQPDKSTSAIAREVLERLKDSPYVHPLPTKESVARWIKKDLRPAA